MAKSSAPAAERPKALASRAVFYRRIARSLAVGTAVVVASLAVGMAGYMGFEGLAPVDAFLNAAMLLSGMGPIHVPQTVAGKLFAGLYALYCGIAVLGVAAVVFAPVIHRVIHHFHLEEDR